MSGFDSYVQSKKNNNLTIASIKRLESELNTQKKKHEELKLENKSLRDRIDDYESVVEKRFGELYSYMHKLESAYYNGLRVPRTGSSILNASSQSNLGKSTLGNLIGEQNETSGQESMEELFKMPQK